MFQSVRSVASLLLSTFFMLTAGGIASYLLPLRAVAEGWSTFTVSMIATGYAIAFTAACIITPRLVKRVGHVRVFGVLTTLMAMSLILHTLIVDPVAWVFIRAMAGFSIAGGYMIIESWLNERAGNENRGMLFSVYMMVCMVGATGGQYVVPLGDPMRPEIFMVCALLYSMALLPTSLSAAQSPQPLTEAKFDLRALFRRSPAAMVGTLLVGIMTGAWFALAPVYISQIKLSATEGATMLAIATIGGALLQFPLGRLSDRIDRRRVMMLAGFIGAGASLAAMILGTTSLLLFYTAVFFLGGAIFPIYALNVAHANDHTPADEFVEVSSGIMLTFGIGTMIGPLLIGAIMEQTGPGGFFAALTVGFIAYSGYVGWRTTRRDMPDEAERSDFQIMPPMREQTPQTAELDPRSDPEYGADSEEDTAGTSAGVV